MFWALFVFATGSDGGGVDEYGSGGGMPRLIAVFDFVLFGVEFFGLARAGFGAVGFATSAPLTIARTAPLAAAEPAWGITCVPTRCRLRKLIDKTMPAPSAGVVGVAGAPATAGEGGGACRLAPAAGGVDLRLMLARSGDDGAEDGEGAQISSGDSWEEVKVSSHTN
jgi:hypothetical protein